MAPTATFDDLAPAANARLRVERLLTHFRRFLSPDDDKILSLEERLATLQPERLPALLPERLPALLPERIAALVPERLATFQNQRTQAASKVRTG